MLSNADAPLLIAVLAPVITLLSLQLRVLTIPPGDCCRRLLSLPCRNPGTPHNRTRCLPMLCRNPLLVVVPCQPSLLLLPLPQPPFLPPYLEADCCIVVIIASWIDIVVVVIAFPPTQIYQSEQRRAETRRTSWRQLCWCHCNVAVGW